MWRKLGFNTIPAAGVSDAPGFPGVLSPTNRSGPAWDGVKYSMITNGPGVNLRLSPAAALAVNFTGLVSAADIPAERAQLVAAAKFFAATEMLDVSYNGYFYRKNVKAMAALVKFSQPGKYTLMCINCDLSFKTDGFLLNNDDDLTRLSVLRHRDYATVC